MSPEKQKIAIAEACGWTHIFHEQGDHVSWGLDPETGYQQMLPRYLIDLNAMHMAERTLSWKDEGEPTSERRRYLMNLEAVIGGPVDRFGDRPNRTMSVPFATAAQRAEAFLRTIGKWQD